VLLAVLDDPFDPMLPLGGLAAAVPVVPPLPVGLLVIVTLLRVNPFTAHRWT
jgi:hypothetical protein